MRVMVTECTVQKSEMCHGISIYNVRNGDGVYGTVDRNMLWYQYM